MSEITAPASAAMPRWLSYAATAAAIVAMLYTAVHFVQSGVRTPLETPQFGQVEIEILPLKAFIERDGAVPVETDNPRQYGPVFFFVMHPLVLLLGNDQQAMSFWLYVLQLICLALSFVFTWGVLKPWVAAARVPALYVVLALAFLWLNFTPMYTILAGKNVEMWELALITGALLAYVRGHRWLPAIAIAAAAMIKLLPFVFFYYFLVKDRRTLVYACVALLGFLLVGHALYGPRMGLMYLPHVADASFGNTWAMGYHENTSLKGLIVKAFGPLVGYTVQLTPQRLVLVQTLSMLAQVVGVAWMTWALTRRGAAASRERRTVWEWSLVATLLLILSPLTAFEYCTLALGAFSYVLVRLLTERASVATWICYGAATLLVATIVPRTVLNRLVFVEQINRLTGYTQLTPSEAYQFYGFPLLGLCFLVAALWQLRNDAPAAVTTGAA